MSSLTPGVENLDIIDMEDHIIDTPMDMDRGSDVEDLASTGVQGEGNQTQPSQETAAEVRGPQVSGDLGTISGAPWEDIQDEGQVQAEPQVGAPKADTVQGHSDCKHNKDCSWCSKSSGKAAMARAPVKAHKETQKIETVLCFFCEGRHRRSEGDKALNSDVCPCVRFLHTVWGSSFKFIKGDFSRAAGVGRRILFYGQLDKKRDPEVIIFRGESPLKAWLRFEHYMLERKYSNVHDQPHRLLQQSLQAIGLEHYSKAWKDALMDQVQKSYDEVMKVDKAVLVKWAAVLACHGYKIWHPIKDFQIYPSLPPVGVAPSAPPALTGKAKKEGKAKPKAKPYDKREQPARTRQRSQSVPQEKHKTGKQTR